MVFRSTNISLRPSTFEASNKIENIYEAESTKAFPCVDILFTHPVYISVSKYELVQNLLYLVADCRSVGVKDSEEINKLGK